MIINDSQRRAILRTTRTLHSVSSLNVRHTGIKRLGIRITLYYPATEIIMIRRARLISPRLAELCLSQLIPGTSSRRLRLTWKEVARGARLIDQVIAIMSEVLHIMYYLAGDLHLIAYLLRINRSARLSIRRVLFKPRHLTTDDKMLIMIPLKDRHREGLVLVMITAVIKTWTSRSHRLLIYRIHNILLRNVDISRRLRTFMRTRIRHKITMCALQLSQQRINSRGQRYLLIILRRL